MTDARKEILKKYFLNPLSESWKQKDINFFINSALSDLDKLDLSVEEIKQKLINPSSSKENNVNFGVVNEYKARFLAQAVYGAIKGKRK